MSDDVPPDRRPRGTERGRVPSTPSSSPTSPSASPPVSMARPGYPLSRESPSAPDDRRRRLRRRRVFAVALIVIVVAAFVGGTVVALGAVAHQFQAGAAAAALPGATESAAPDASAAPTASAAPSSSPTSSARPAPPAPPAFDKSAKSVDDPNSIWVVVNKQRPIADGANFVPPGNAAIPSDLHNPWGQSLRPETTAALEAMAAAVRAEVDTTLVAESGYRSFDSQTRAYNGYVHDLGQAGADATSARPGFSEHQTGLAVDILDSGTSCNLDSPCFGSTPTGVWLAANAYRFGFILRYPADKTAVTGYEYEPWHFRFVGVDLATEMHNTGVETLEEFFGLPAAPDYAG